MPKGPYTNYFPCGIMHMHPPTQTSCSNSRMFTTQPLCNFSLHAFNTSVREFGLDDDRGGSCMYTKKEEKSAARERATVKGAVPRSGAQAAGALIPSLRLGDTPFFLKERPQTNSKD